MLHRHALADTRVLFLDHSGRQGAPHFCDHGLAP
jgi:hypothetical protein